MILKEIIITCSSSCSPSVLLLLLILLSITGVLCNYFWRCSLIPCRFGSASRRQGAVLFLLLLDSGETYASSRTISSFVFSFSSSSKLLGASAARWFSTKCARKLPKCAKKCASLKCQNFYYIFGCFRGGTKINLQKYFEKC